MAAWVLSVAWRAVRCYVTDFVQLSHSSAGAAGKRSSAKESIFISSSSFGSVSGCWSEIPDT